MSLLQQIFEKEEDNQNNYRFLVGMLARASFQEILIGFLVLCIVVLFILSNRIQIALDFVSKNLQPKTINTTDLCPKQILLSG